MGVVCTVQTDVGLEDCCYISTAQKLSGRAKTFGLATLTRWRADGVFGPLLTQYNWNTIDCLLLHYIISGFNAFVWCSGSFGRKSESLSWGGKVKNHTTMLQACFLNFLWRLPTFLWFSWRHDPAKSTLFSSLRIELFTELCATIDLTTTPPPTFSLSSCQSVGTITLDCYYSINETESRAHTNKCKKYHITGRTHVPRCPRFLGGATMLL